MVNIVTAGTMKSATAPINARSVHLGSPLGNITKAAMPTSAIMPKSSSQSTRGVVCLAAEATACLGSTQALGSRWINIDGSKRGLRAIAPRMLTTPDSM
jgi:hypothetical protein